MEQEGAEDAEEEPVKMIEVVFKTGKFGLKTLEVEADQSTLDVTLLIVAAIENKSKEAVHEEFDEAEV